MVVSTVITFILAFLAFTAWSAPLNKCVDQTISASTIQWVQACLAAGGAEQCGTVSQTAFMTLLAAAGPCDQQNAADQMVDLAKPFNNDADMIKFAQIFVQQPRNSPDSFPIPYCQQAPSNTELNGLFQCQFEGTKDGFVPGAEGTVPFGLQSLDMPKSCPANPKGGVPDGQQLVDISQDPGLQNVNSSDSDSPRCISISTEAPAATDSAMPRESSNDSSGGTKAAVSSAAVTEVPDTSPTGCASATTTSPSGSILPLVLCIVGLLFGTQIDVVYKKGQSYLSVRWGNVPNAAGGSAAVENQ